VSSALVLGQGPEVLTTTEYGYVLHLVAPGAETRVLDFRSHPLAVGDSFAYGGHDWVVSDILLRLTDTTSFEVWAEPADETPT
jgi:hypothetical protein